MYVDMCRSVPEHVEVCRSVIEPKCFTGVLLQVPWSVPGVPE